jgi:hypothetical protein
MERASSSQNDDQSNAADRNGSERPRERRSGEGSDSALARLKKIERERQRARPSEDHGEAKR